MKRFLLGLVVLCLLLPLACAEDKMLTIKSDSSWKASKSVSGVDWMQPSFDDSSWGSSTANWNHGPCSINCGKVMSCAVGCNEWMWTANSCENCFGYFRKAFDVGGELVSGTITISADDYYWLYVNGERIGTSEAKSVAYARSDSYDITSFLHTGNNVIAIKVENKKDFEGVVVRSEVKYKTSDPLIGQLQAQVVALQSQMDKLTGDKTRLEGQVDSLQSQNNELNSAKEQLASQVSALTLESSNLKTELEQTQSDLGRYKMFVVALILAAFVLLVGLFLCLHYIYEKSKKRQPTISVTPKSSTKEVVRKPAEIDKRQEKRLEEVEVHSPQKNVRYDTLQEEGRSSGSKLFP
ncbi:MAG: hypothetical protein NTU61_03705 [Candidatus Altiarchaeota archaeon]|nr:hypothetical protein [Candidatus Altiarchaeota archaeon]